MLREAAARPRARIILTSALKSTALLRCGTAQDGVDLPRDLVDIGHAVDRLKHAFGTVIGQDRRSLAVIGGESRLDRLGSVVRAARKALIAADIAHPDNL